MYKKFHFWQDCKKHYCKVDDEDAPTFDNVPVKTIKEACIEFLANGQIAENNMRKIYFGEQYDTSDNMEYIDLAQKMAQDKIAMFRKQNELATKEHNDDLKEEKQEQINEEVANNAKKKGE